MAGSASTASSAGRASCRSRHKVRPEAAGSSSPAPVPTTSSTCYAPPVDAVLLTGTFNAKIGTATRVCYGYACLRLGPPVSATLPPATRMEPMASNGSTRSSWAAKSL